MTLHVPQPTIVAVRDRLLGLDIFFDQSWY